MRLTARLVDRVERNFYERCPPDERPAFLRSLSEPSRDADSNRTSINERLAATDVEKADAGVESEKEKGAEKEEYDAEKLPTVFPPAPFSTVAPTPSPPNPKSHAPRCPTELDSKTRAPKYDRSLVRALHATFWVRWWSAGVARLLSDTLKTASPLVSKELLVWLSASYTWHAARADPGAREGMDEPRGIGYGIGLAFALFAVQELSSLIFNHFMLCASLLLLSWPGSLFTDPILQRRSRQVSLCAQPS